MLGSLDQFFADWDNTQRQAEQSATGEDAFQFQLANVSVEPITVKKSKTEETLNKLKSPWDISFPSAMMWGVLATAAGFAISTPPSRPFIVTGEQTASADACEW